MPIAIARVEDDDSDIVKVSPPNSSDSLSLMSYHSDIPLSVQSEPNSGSDRTASSISSSEIYTSDRSAQDDSNHSAASSDKQRIKEEETSAKWGKGAQVEKELKHGIKDDGEVLKDVQGVVEDTVRRVRQQSDKFQLAAQPYADKTRSFAERRPIFFTFIALWAAFSAIPLVIFAGFTIAATVFIASSAVFVVALTVLGAVLLGASVLVCTILFGVTILLPFLFITTFLAAGALCTLLGLFLVHRLYLHLSASSTEDGLNSATVVTALKSWTDETVDRVPLPFVAPRFASNEPNHKTLSEKKVDVARYPQSANKLDWEGEKWAIDEKAMMNYTYGGGETPKQSDTKPNTLSILSEKEGQRYESKPTPRLDVWPAAPHAQS